MIWPYGMAWSSTTVFGMVSMSGIDRPGQAVDKHRSFTAQARCCARRAPYRHYRWRLVCRAAGFGGVVPCRRQPPREGFSNGSACADSAHRCWCGRGGGGPADEAFTQCSNIVEPMRFGLGPELADNAVYTNGQARHWQFARRIRRGPRGWAPASKRHACTPTMIRQGRAVRGALDPAGVSPCW